MALSQIELMLLSVIEKRGLVRRGEIPFLLKEVNGASLSALSSLLELGFVTTISPLGEKSYAITRSGLNALKETIKS